MISNSRARAFSESVTLQESPQALHDDDDDDDATGHTHALYIYI